MVPKYVKSASDVTDQAYNTFVSAFRAELTAEATKFAKNEAEQCLKMLKDLEAVVSGLNTLPGKKRPKTSPKTSPKAKGKKNNSEGRGLQHHGSVLRSTTY